MTVQGSVVTETNRKKTCLLHSQCVVSTKLRKIIVRSTKSWQQLCGIIKHFRPYLYGRKFKVVSEGSNFLSNLFKIIYKLLKIRYKQRLFILNRMVVWKGVTGYLQNTYGTMCAKIRLIGMSGSHMQYVYTTPRYIRPLHTHFSS